MIWVYRPQKKWDEEEESCFRVADNYQVLCDDCAHHSALTSEVGYRKRSIFKNYLFTLFSHICINKNKNIQKLFFVPFTTKLIFVPSKCKQISNNNNNVNAIYLLIDMMLLLFGRCWLETFPGVSLRFHISAHFTFLKINTHTLLCPQFVYTHIRI